MLFFEQNIEIQPKMHKLNKVLARVNAILEQYRSQTNFTGEITLAMNSGTIYPMS